MQELIPDRVHDRFKAYVLIVQKIALEESCKSSSLKGSRLILERVKAYPREGVDCSCNAGARV